MHKLVSSYLEEFDSKEDIESEYKCKIPDDVEILLAYYGYGSYCGASFVIYRQNGKLYEVNGSHCSCSGLEYQWEPEETTVEALRTRKFYTEDGGELAQQKLDELLDALEQC